MPLLGKRIDDPIAIRLAEALGNKSFKNVTPVDGASLGSDKLGIKVGASASRSHFDRIAPRYAERLRPWHHGKIRSMA
ncbi:MULTISPECIES: hypothetical protein [Variovorax]|jgi:hypothetical protein|uniref:hypothetical protein n=1 Tax=Variovorax TaxID=34072 RepID=UPI00086DE3C4|nr:MULTISPECIES: hypothetical protein [Variovorax]MBN8755947.1 hypothetical protein [Variovorax sp.]ODU11848.1 MAG: hypothetical protein ABS94_34455 [Variovorax sp. SCN 67-85]ODV14790.1 MAG: hypothetical protein ABT25_33495 [Variovorax sp. SCN 67-20]UKI05057.1 hypothetical protein L3V85_19650 [Variovorax paradoxus]